MSETGEIGHGLREALRSALAHARKLPFKEVVDTLAKLAAPAAVVVGALLAQNFQSSQSVSQLLNAREESDTKIRAEMFKAITDRLVGGKGGDLDPGRQAVFTELLALNFHEHIELKPLMTEVDADLLRSARTLQAGDERKAIEDRREELRSVARRVRARQTAMVYRPSDLNEGALASFGWIPSPQTIEQRAVDEGLLRKIGVRFDGVPNSPSPAGEMNCDVIEGGNRDEGQNICGGEPVFEESPDHKAILSIVVRKGDAGRETFLVRVKPIYPSARTVASGKSVEGKEIGQQCGAQAEDSEPVDASVVEGVPPVEFETSWFDFPLTDNTLLASGARYSIFVDQVCYDKQKSLKGVTLGLLWFPRDYFPARERPTNYRQFREKLHLPVED